MVDTALLRQLVSVVIGAMRRRARRRAAFAVNCVIYVLYHVVSHRIWPGQSIGKRLFRLKVVCTPDPSEDGSGNSRSDVRVGLLRMVVRSLLFARTVWASSWHSRFLALDVAVRLSPDQPITLSGRQFHWEHCSRTCCAVDVLAFLLLRCHANITCLLLCYTSPDRNAGFMCCDASLQIGLLFGGRARRCLHDSITGTKVVAVSPAKSDQ
jgi:hypothetical protein